MSDNSISTGELLRVGLLSGLTAEEAALVARGTEVVEFRPGQVVIRQETAGRELWVLLAGRCEVIRRNEQGEPLVLAELSPYQLFGEMSFFDGAPISADVSAKSGVRLLRFDRAGFEKIAAENPAVAVKLLENIIMGLAGRLRRMDQWVSDLAAAAPPAAESDWRRLRAKMLESWLV